MKHKFIFIILLCIVISAISAIAQSGNDTAVVLKDDPLAVKLTQSLSETDTYVWPKDPKVYENLALLGKWLDINGESIYETNPVEPFLDGQVAYTAKGDHTIYAIYMPAKDEKALPSEIIVKTKLAGKLKASLLASKQILSVKTVDGGIKILIPQNLRAGLAKQEAAVVRIINN